MRKNFKGRGPIVGAYESLIRRGQHYRHTQKQMSVADPVSSCLFHQRPTIRVVDLTANVQLGTKLHPMLCPITNIPDSDNWGWPQRCGFTSQALRYKQSGGNNPDSHPLGAGGAGITPAI